jgi:hypothetical protein
MDLPEFDIFLSYKSEDREWVQKLRSALRERGVRVWVDRHEIRPGDLFAEALESGLESSRTMGLVVTEGSFQSGWVREEYYRALSLTKAHHLHLIPILVEDTEPPGFLGSRQYVDFRSESHFENAVDSLVWPGITARRITLFFHGLEGVLLNTWDRLTLRTWQTLAEIIKHDAIDIPVYDEPWSLKKEVISAIRRGYRTVVLSDPFSFWPWQDFNNDRLEAKLSEIFDVRANTRGTEDETVFVIHSHPDALTKAPHLLSDGIQQRLSRYFFLPMTFYDSDYNESYDPTEEDVNTLSSNWRTVWYKIQRELLRSERQNFGKSLS